MHNIGPESHTNIGVFSTFQHGPLKKWIMPFCAFFSAFTLVMTILVFSIDLRGHHYIHFNATNIFDFENTAQYSVKLVNLLRKEYFHQPVLQTESKDQIKYAMKPPSWIFKYLRKKRGGVFVEIGGWVRYSGSEWLERERGWRGLTTEAHPGDFTHLQALRRPRLTTANLCISPTSNPKYAWFKDRRFPAGNSTSPPFLTRVACFPLFSLLLAFNSTSVDLLIVNLSTAQLQVMKTLPFNRVSIKIVGFIADGNLRGNSTCCSQEMSLLMGQHGYKRFTSCPSRSMYCYFVQQRYTLLNQFL